MNKTVVPQLCGEEAAALSYLPDRLSTEVKKYAALYGGFVNEIRLRRGGVLSITVMGENVNCKITVTEKECADTLLRLCNNSIYSHTDTLKSGFVTTPEGIRVGICGKAVCENGEITAVANAGYICIRIPRRIPGAGDVAYEILKEMNFQRGIIIWSKPGIGKTTLLRELAVRLGGGACGIRTAVIDTRHELGYGVKGGLIDILDGYPRSKGMEIAKRTMSPQIILCDEISETKDANAILDAAGSGIPVAASVHAGSMAELCKKEYMKPIIEAGCIGAYIGLLEQTYKGYKYDIYRCDENSEIIFER